MIAFRIFVEGRVQGVGYRNFAKRVADSYGLSGWVRNLPDGRVEVYVTGDDEVLWYFIKDLMEGPPLADVKSIHIVKEGFVESTGSFDIRY